MLYDGQTDHDFLVLYNRTQSFMGGLNRDIPWDFRQVFEKIYDEKQEDTPDIVGKSVLWMEMAELSCNRGLDKPMCKFIRSKDFITLKKTRGSHLDNYNGYDVYWNETKSGINIHEWEVAGVWNAGNSSYSTIRLWETKDIRESLIRDRKLNDILQ